MFFSVETFAGTGAAGSGDGPAATATFDLPSWITASPAGVVYVSETFQNRIRRIEGATVSTLTSGADGSADGPLSTALFSGPSGIAMDRVGNLYVADQSNHRIRKIDPSGTVSTVAGPSCPEQIRGWVDDLPDISLFARPKAIAIDAASANLYVGEHHRIRRFPLLSQDGVSMEVRTVAAVGIKGFADGSPTVAQFNGPLGIAVAQTGDIFVADTGNFRIRRVTPAGTVSTLAGDGVPAIPTDAAQVADERPALQARFERPSDLAIDQAGTVWITDGTHLRFYSPLRNTVSTACSDQRHERPIAFERMEGIALSEGRIFVVDGNKVLVLTPHPD